MKVYETGLSTYALGIATYAAGGHISVTGGNSNAIYSQGNFLETDVFGNLVRFNSLDSGYTDGGRAIVYNTTAGYAVYGGSNMIWTTVHGYLAKNNTSNNSCASSYTPTEADIAPEIVNNNALPEQVNETPEIIMAYSVTTSEALMCGVAQKRVPAEVELSQNDKITVYPNPTNDLINVVVPKEMTSGNIEVLDLIGRTVYSGEFSNVDQVRNINISALSPGSYLIIVKKDHVKYNEVFNKY
jgi:hypothetical protein